MSATEIDRVWGLADKLSDQAHKAHQARKVWTAIVASETQCGSCKAWMTDDCPREIQDNRRGGKVGPSSQALKCGQFEIKAWDKQRLAELREEYAELTGFKP